VQEFRQLTAPISRPSTDATAPPATTIVDSVSTATTSVVAAGAKPDAIIVSAAKRHVWGLAESVRQGSAESIGLDPVKTVAPLIDRLPVNPDGTERPILLDISNRVTVGAVLPSDGPPQTGEESSTAGAPNLPGPPQAGFFSHWRAIAAGGYVREHLTLSELGKVETVGLASNRPGNREQTRSAAAGRVSTTLDRAAKDHLGSPAPLDPSPSAPESPGAIASGLGGSFFVPFVALLALLALVAAAALRRLTEAPDFRAPTPFVCALERPG
jgi:hypothetical protein